MRSSGGAADSSSITTPSFTRDARDALLESGLANTSALISRRLMSCRNPSSKARVASPAWLERVMRGAHMSFVSAWERRIRQEPTPCTNTRSCVPRALRRSVHDQTHARPTSASYDCLRFSKRAPMSRSAIPPAKADEWSQVSRLAIRFGGPHPTS